MNSPDESQINRSVSQHDAQNDEQISITGWFDQLRMGDEEAAKRLWERYFQQLVGLARAKLRGNKIGVADEEDVAISVFATLCSSAKRGMLPDVSNRDELWRVLLSMTRHRVIDHARSNNRQKRGGGADRDMYSDERDYAKLNGEKISRSNPTALVHAELQENYDTLLALLRNDLLRRVAVMRMEGHTNAEIAELLKVSERTVERKLKLIRADWQEHFDERNKHD